MTVIRCVLLVVLVAVAVAVSAYPKTACGDGPSHHLFLGNRQWSDRLLYSSREEMSSSFMRKKSKDFDWPLRGKISHETITRIEVHDQKTDGSGGCAFLTQGGVGSHNVRLHLKTQRGKGYSFFIAIYGK